jgi:hypothetical protein
VNLSASYALWLILWKAQAAIWLERDGGFREMARHNLPQVRKSSRLQALVGLSRTG